MYHTLGSPEFFMVHFAPQSQNRNKARNQQTDIIQFSDPLLNRIDPCAVFADTIGRVLCYSLVRVDVLIPH